MYELVLVFDYVIYGSTLYRLKMLPNVDLRWNRFTHRKWKWIGCLVKKWLHAFAYDHQKIPNFKNIILTFLIFWKNWMKNVNFYFSPSNDLLHWCNFVCRNCIFIKNCNKESIERHFSNQFLASSWNSNMSSHQSHPNSPFVRQCFWYSYNF